MSNNRDSWVVLKFGGTSVSSLSNWRNIAGVVRDRIAEGLRPVVVHSALSGVTDRLEALLAAAVAGDHSAALARLEASHRELAAQLGITPDTTFENFLLELRELAAAIGRHGEVDDRARARVMSMGELLATCLGCDFLNAQGIDTTGWMPGECFAPTNAPGLPRPICCPPPAILRRTPNCRRSGAPSIESSSPRDSSRRTRRATRYFWGAGDQTRRAPTLPRNWPPRDSRSGPTSRVCSAPIPAPFRRPGCCARCTTTRRRRLRATAPKCCIRAA